MQHRRPPPGNPDAYPLHPIEVVRSDGSRSYEYCDNTFAAVLAAAAAWLAVPGVVSVAPVLGASVPVRVVR